MFVVMLCHVGVQIHGEETDLIWWWVKHTERNLLQSQRETNFVRERACCGQLISIFSLRNVPQIRSSVHSYPKRRTGNSEFDSMVFGLLFFGNG